MPADAREWSPATRLAKCSDEALAIFKRCAFLHVDTPLISTFRRNEHVGKRKAEFAAKAAQLRCRH